DDAAVEVAEVVGQVGVIGAAELLPAKLTVRGKRTFPQEVVAERLVAELRDDVHRLDDIAESLADLLDDARLLVLDVDEAVGEDPARRVDVGSEAHRRPQGAVEARDVLADEMDVGRPPLLEALLVAAIANRRDIVQERIEPDIDGEP